MISERDAGPKLQTEPNDNHQGDEEFPNLHVSGCLLLDYWIDGILDCWSAEKTNDPSIH